MEEKEITAKLKNCKTVEELKAAGKEMGYDLSDDEAKAYLERFSKSGELSDDELSNVSGGCAKWRRGSAYSGDPPHYLIVTTHNRCTSYVLYDYTPEIDKKLIGAACATCAFVKKPERGLAPMYCTKRKYDDDPYNPPK